MPFGLRHGEACFGETAPHGAGDREGAKARAGRRARRDFGIEPGVPHAGILRRAETVEEPGICPEVALRKRFLYVAEMQDEAHAVGRKAQLAHAAHRCRPLRDKLSREFRKLGPGRERARRIRCGEREKFEADKGQPGIRRRAMRLPELPEGEKVEPGSEAGFGDGERRPARPGLRKAAALQEHGARLGKAVLRREVHVRVRGRERRAVFRPVQFRMLQQPCHCAEVTCMPLLE